ncbi:MAG: HD-GYP domain-containing protein [Halanaerobiales bacterium]|nr:HD-GYP domain-containing protein [Halanaerobiales bacterium]
MRLVSLNDITLEMTLAKPIYYNDRILLNIDCKDISKYRERLIEFGINYVYINDELSEGIAIEDIIKDETRQKSKKIIKDTLNSRLNNIFYITETQVANIQNVVYDMVDEISQSDEVIVNLLDIKAYDSYTFSHSVNVTVLSLILGKALYYTREQLIKLGIGALLHDFGKTMIPLEILNKPDKLTDEEFEIVKEHSRLGYERLKDQTLISPLSRAVILSHHEKVDGTGYPKGLKNDEIHDYAKIVAIADVFDSLNSDRVYRKRWPTYKIVDFILSNVDKHFEKQFVNKFLKYIAVYPNGTFVTLSNGQKAIVQKQNKNCPTKPIVKIIQDMDGRKMSQTVNLMDQLDLVVVISHEGESYN